MLYDKRWEKKVAGDEGVSPEIFSLDGLIAWLEKQPADMTYVWEDCDGACLIGIYFTSMNVAHNEHGYSEVFYGAGENYNFDGSYGAVCMAEPRTFGAALSRARKIAEAR